MTTTLINGSVVTVPPSLAPSGGSGGGGGGGGGGLDPGQILAAPAASYTEDGTEAWPIIQDGILKKFTYIPPRKTQDMTPFTSLIGSELIPGYNASTGLEGQISFNAMAKLLTGFINPKLPPYNCKGDLLQARDGVSNSTTIFTSATGLFNPLTDIGKLFFVNTGGGIYQRTIASVQSSTQVTLSSALATSGTGCFYYFGTDDTAGMQAAINACAAPGLNNFGGGVFLPAGNYLCGPLTYLARMVICGPGGRSATLSRKPDSSGTAFITALNTSVDFPIIVDLGMDGLRYVQPVASHILRYDGALGSAIPAFGGPAPYFARLFITYGSFCGLVHTNQGAGEFNDIQIDSCAFQGFKSAGFDMAINDMIVYQCNQTGIYFDGAGSANNNLRGFYSYFNGAGSNTATADLNANLYLGGGGHNISSGRCQESWGSNIVIGGNRMLLGDVRCDDTGCFYPAHGAGQNPTASTVRAGILMQTGSTITGYLNNVRVGTAVHTVNYATHAIFFSGNASNNRGSVVTEPGITWYNGGSSVTGATVVPTTGDYAPGPWGTDSSGGVGSSNLPLTVDGVQVS